VEAGLLYFTATMNGMLCLVWLLAVAGNAKLLAICENVLHGFAIPRATLQRIRGVHNLAFITYPLVLGWFVAARWGHADGTTFLHPIWVPGFVGFGLLGAASLRHLTARTPANVSVHSAQVVDIAARVGRDALIGDGRATRLARLPRNEQFTLDIVERQVWLERLPKVWDGLTLVHFSDLHFRGPVTVRYFEEVFREAQRLQGDIVCFTGDLMDHPRCLEWIAPTFGALSAPLGCYFVLGNHDWYLTATTAAMRAQVAAAGWIELAGQTYQLERGGVPLVLAGTERPWMGSAPVFDGHPADAPRIVLSHGPDQVMWGSRTQVDLMLAGHTHGGQIRLPVLGPVYSPSRFSCRFASGDFRIGPTTLIVSRGISGREPVRYNCRPELSRITLRSGLSPASGAA
jgi:predicted MPP superfamily phosphohydrolase